MKRTRQVGVKVLALFVLAAVFAGPSPAFADAQQTSTYQQAVQEALDIVSTAQPGDTAAAQKALNALESGTGQGQPEIAQDLRLRPPDFKDAGSRLQTLLDALSAPATTTDPQQAQQQLRQVLSMHRYDSLHQPPSLLDRISQWIQDRINDLLRTLFGAGGRGFGRIPALYFYVVAALLVAGAAVIIFLATRGRLAADAIERVPAGPRAPADYFDDADRLAAAGDRVGAIRALCAGVAATLAGEQSWTGSPLTVREIFQRADEPARLRPLLLPFEAAVYGGRDVGTATYERAVLAASPFRKPVAPEEAAA